MLYDNGFNKRHMPTEDKALPGRTEPLPLTNQHFVLKNPLKPPYPDNSEFVIVGMGCFWGAEKAFWSLPGIITTSVGYSAGYTPNPTYEEVCSGMTGHNEVVLIVFDTKMTTLNDMLTVFWESHNPTQGMRQGNDHGTQYRSGIYFTSEKQKRIIELSKQHYQMMIDSEFGQGQVLITTEVLPATTFYFAEDYHQQYLAKNPNGYCRLSGLGLKF